MQGQEGTVEFKEKPPDSKTAADYSVGIGNQGGGWLIVGITDKPPRQICGVAQQSPADLQRLRDSIFDQTSIRAEPQLLSTSDGDVLVIAIPGRRQGQVLCTKSGKYLTRSGSSLRGMTPDEIAGILAESAPLIDPIQRRIDGVDLRFSILAGHPAWYILQVENRSEEEVLLKQITLKKGDIELAPPACVTFLLPPGQGVPVGWKPDSDPMTKLELLGPAQPQAKYPLPFAADMEVFLQCQILGQKKIFSKRVLVEVSVLHRSIRQV